MVDERRLDFGGRDVVAGDEHDVVDAAEQPEVTVVVALGAVAGEVFVAEARPVRVAVTPGVAPDAAQHRRPGARQHEIATTGDADGLARIVDDVRLEAGQGERRAPGLQGGRAGRRADENRARPRLPPGVDAGAARPADLFVVPDPGLRVDG